MSAGTIHQSSTAKPRTTTRTNNSRSTSSRDVGDIIRQWLEPVQHLCCRKGFVRQRRNDGLRFPLLRVESSRSSFLLLWFVLAVNVCCSTSLVAWLPTNPTTTARTRRRTTGTLLLLQSVVGDENGKTSTSSSNDNPSLLSSPSSSPPLPRTSGAAPRRNNYDLDEMMMMMGSSSNDNNNHNDDLRLLDAAATATQQSCHLLGIKSIGVDYGLVRTGLAVTVGYDPKPLAIVSDYDANTTQLCYTILRVCQSERADQIVVGLPLHKNGTEAEQTHLTRTFAQTLAQMTLSRIGPRVPVYMWDERYTSKFAAARAHSRRQSRTSSSSSSTDNGSLYGTLDADAACIILEHFYSQNGKDAHRVTIDDDNVYRECLREWETVRNQKDQQRQQATELRLGGRSSQRQEAMERARQVEAELEKEGMLGVSRKKKKQQQAKKKREKRGPWLTPPGGGGGGSGDTAAGNA